MLVGINSAAELDQIILSGELTKDSSDAEGLYNFSFRITNGDIVRPKFTLLVTSPFPADGLSASFNIREDCYAKLYVRATPYMPR